MHPLRESDIWLILVHSPNPSAAFLHMPEVDRLMDLVRRWLFPERLRSIPYQRVWNILFLCTAGFSTSGTRTEAQRSGGCSHVRSAQAAQPASSSGYSISSGCTGLKGAGTFRRWRSMGISAASARALAW